MKILSTVVLAALTSFAALAHASNLPVDSTDGKTHINAPRDPYTDGAKAGKFDVYSEGARSVTDRRDPFTDGAHG
ncbi:hypothetical protein CupriaWKF_29550 [Cupriavidus sp. WKF15]|uniref:hypothetical protein n=1 Tax=Cupriavidus sp. WKF15 TaxID=3032282 RepID=UPI0023E27CB8|nr:hypothetical protein [Cupriavidus sp. WKF15]WER48901.1 hypothetical protein CupriaWKF_29550 [Cupriavidus sp. WKF15]